MRSGLRRARSSKETRNALRPSRSSSAKRSPSTPRRPSTLRVENCRLEPFLVSCSFRLQAELRGSGIPPKGGNYRDTKKSLVRPRATSGSTRDARRAGIRHAAIATAVSTTVMTLKVSGSVGVTCTSSVRRTRLRPNAPARPSDEAESHLPQPATQDQPPDLAAARAERHPHADLRRRCVTEYAITA